MTQSKLPTNQKQNSQTEDRVVMVEGEGGAGGKGPEFRVSRYKLFYAQLMNNQVLMYSTWASQVALVLKNLACQSRRCKRCEFDPRIGKIPRRRKWQLTPGYLPGESHAQRSLGGYSRQGLKRVRHD